MSLMGELSSSIGWGCADLALRLSLARRPDTSQVEVALSSDLACCTRRLPACKALDLAIKLPALAELRKELEVLSVALGKSLRRARGGLYD